MCASMCFVSEMYLLNSSGRIKQILRTINHEGAWTETVAGDLRYSFDWSWNEPIYYGICLGVSVRAFQRGLSKKDDLIWLSVNSLNCWLQIIFFQCFTSFCSCFCSSFSPSPPPHPYSFSFFFKVIISIRDKFGKVTRTQVEERGSYLWGFWYTYSKGLWVTCPLERLTFSTDFWSCEAPA